MKLYFKGKLPEEKVALDVVREFCNIDSPKKSCYMQGKEVEIKIITKFNFSWFISVLKDCEIEELHITPEGEETENVKKDDSKDTDKQVIDSKAKMEDSKPEECSTNVGAKGKEKLVEDVLENTKKVKEVKPKKDKSKATEEVDKKELEAEKIVKGFAKQSVSFESFVKNIATWLELGKRQAVFEEMIEAATHMEDITSKNITDVLSQKGISFGNPENISFGRKIKKKFEGNMSLMRLVKIIASYKDFEFKNEEETVEAKDSEIKNKERVAGVKASEVKDEAATEAKDSEIKDKEKVVEAKDSEVKDEEKTAEPKRIKMDCMPEIPAFEELLGSIDKTQPLKIRVYAVLTQMGLDKLAFEEKCIVKHITNRAMTMKEISIKDICENYMKRSIGSTMIFSQFINDFVQQYEKEKFVKSEVFLKELQKIIVKEKEIIN